MFKLFGHLSPILGYLSPIIVLYENGDPPAGDPPSGNPPAGTPPAGTPPSKWTDALPDNIKAHPIFQKYGSANEALSAFVDVQKLIGPEKIIMPSKDAKPEEWNERVFNRLGRPEKPEGYALPTDLQIPKELPMSDKLIQSFREKAHTLGILPQQFAGLYKWFMGEQITQYNDLITAQKDNVAKAVTALRSEWGAAYDQNLALAEKVLNSYGDADTVAFIKHNGLNADTNFVKFLHNIGKVLSEDQLTGKPPQLTMSPEEAKTALREMEGNPKHPLFDAQHPEHKAAMQKREQLYRLAFPS